MDHYKNTSDVPISTHSFILHYSHSSGWNGASEIWFAAEFRFTILGFEEGVVDVVRLTFQFDVGVRIVKFTDPQLVA